MAVGGFGKGGGCVALVGCLPGGPNPVPTQASRSRLNSIPSHEKKIILLSVSGIAVYLASYLAHALASATGVKEEREEREGRSRRAMREKACRLVLCAESSRVCRVCRECVAHVWFSFWLIESWVTFGRQCVCKSESARVEDRRCEECLSGGGGVGEMRVR